MTALEAILADLPNLAIAVSGGVDSMTLAHAAHRAGVPGLIVGLALGIWTVARFAGLDRIALGGPTLMNGADSFGNPTAVAKLLFRDFLLPFEVTSILILIAILGAVVLARREE